jgi:hypothetical protein
LKFEPATYDVQMIVDQARQHAPALEVDDPGPLACELHHFAIVPDGGESAVPDRDSACGGIGTIERRKQSTMQIRCRGRLGHECTFGDRLWGRVAAAPSRRGGSAPR